MESVAIKVKVRQGKLAEAKQWFRGLAARGEEILESMEAEGAYLESAFLDCEGGDNHIIYYMRASSVSEAYRVFQSSVLPIDEWYKAKWAELFEGRQELPVVFEIERVR